MGPIGRGIVRAFLVVVLAGGIGGEPVETSYFWTTEGIGDGPSAGYTQDTLAEWQRMLWNQDPTTEGVATTYQGGLAVTAPGGLVLRVASGGGVVYGYGYRSTGNVDHTLVLPLLGNTGWRVVLRTDWATRTVRSALLQSADGVAAIPAVTQVAGVTWEISLAHGIVSVAGAVTIQGDDRTPLGSGGRFTVGTDDIADSAVTPLKILDRTRTVYIPIEYAWDAASSDWLPYSLLWANGGWYIVQGGGTETLTFSFYCPADYAGGGSIQLVFAADTAGGFIRAQWTRMYLAQVGEAENTHNLSGAAASYPVGALVGGQITLMSGCLIALAPTLAVGDWVRGELTLLTSDANWTNAGVVAPRGFVFTYTADS